MRILIAEDNQEIAHLIQMFLEKEGYEVVWKADGQQALDYLLSEEAALCIFDIMMPRMDGFTLIQKVRKFSNVPILVLTAKNMEQDKICLLYTSSRRVRRLLPLCFLVTANGSDQRMCIVMVRWLSF